MARLLDNAASEYLNTGTAPVSGTPFSMACWFYADDVTALRNIICISDESDADNEEAVLRLRGDIANDPIEVAHDWGPAGQSARASNTGVTVNTWHHGLAVFASDSSRSVYLDGGSKRTNSDVGGAFSDLDNYSIGIRYCNSKDRYWSGRVAEVAVWNVALTDADATVLASGYSPLFVKPESLVSYIPLIRDDDIDHVGDYDMTAFNAPSVADHPPMVYPVSPPIMSAIPTAGATGSSATIPVFMRYYRNMRT